MLYRLKFRERSHHNYDESVQNNKQTVCETSDKHVTTYPHSRSIVGMARKTMFATYIKRKNKQQQQQNRTVQKNTIVRVDDPFFTVSRSSEM